MPLSLDSDGDQASFARGVRTRARSKQGSCGGIQKSRQESVLHLDELEADYSVRKDFQKVTVFVRARA